MNALTYDMSFLWGAFNVVGSLDNCNIQHLETYTNFERKIG